MSEKVDTSMRDLKRERVGFRVADLAPWLLNTTAMIATGYVYDQVLRPAVPAWPAINGWGWAYLGLMCAVFGVKP